MGTYTWESSDQGWSAKANDFGDTGSRSSGAICATTGYWETVASFEPSFGNRGVVQTVIQTDSTLTFGEMTIYFEILNIDYTYSGNNLLTIRWADSSSGPWSGSGASYGVVDQLDLGVDEVDGCASFATTESATGKYIRVILSGFGDTMTLPAGKIYQINAPGYGYTRSTGGIPGSII